MLERDDLDRRLDSALATYAEPRTGIEQRILARICEARDAGRASRRRWLLWAVTIPAFCILLYIVIPGPTKNREKSEEQVAKELQPSRPAGEGSQKEPLHAAMHLRRQTESIKPHAAAVPAQPKLDVFPAPRPLSAQEQALIRLADQTPELQRAALATPEQEDAPLQISAIQIPPISPPDEGKN